MSFTFVGVFTSEFLLRWRRKGRVVGVFPSPLFLACWLFVLQLIYFLNHEFELTTQLLFESRELFVSLLAWTSSATQELGLPVLLFVLWRPMRLVHKLWGACCLTKFAEPCPTTIVGRGCVTASLCFFVSLSVLARDVAKLVFLLPLFVLQWYL